MMYDFDTPVDRRDTDSAKWGWFGEGILPLWVADMDFRSPEPVIAALHERVEQGTFGYAMPPRALTEVILSRLAHRHHIDARADDILYVPGLVPAMNMVARAIGEPGDGIAMSTPIYHPFLHAVEWAGRTLNSAETQPSVSGHILHYEIDFDALEATITPRTRLFMLCNPHNPLGRVYTRVELERIADLCLRHDLILCSDEIHCDLILDGEHISVASLSPEIAERTITLLAPSKTFNLPGLGCGFAVIPNAELRTKIGEAGRGMVPFVNALGLAGAQAAYQHGQPWLDALLPYLRANRDALIDYVAAHLPGVTLTCPEGTYLAWLDFRALNLPDKPADFFLSEAKVALNAGDMFGPGGEGRARLNFACPRAMLMQALDQMRAALERVRA